LRSAFRVAGFRARGHLEHISRIVLHGFVASSDGAMGTDLISRLDRIAPDFRGFAYTGAGIRLALLDTFMQDEERRLSRFILGPAVVHAPMVQLGVGWAIALAPFLRRQEHAYLSHPDEMLRWIPLCGLGLHHVYFHWTRYVERQLQVEGLSRLGQQVFDQGVGFGIWLGEGISMERVSATAATFPPVRQPDLWTGVGFGAAYTGGPSGAGLEYLRDASGPFDEYLAEGAAMAARTRYKADNVTVATDMACRKLCGMSAETASQWTDEAAEQARSSGTPQKYEVWRLRIRSRF
jgi:hypothetical protein